MEAPRARRAVGRFKVARYVAMAGKPQKEVTDDQEYELYDLSEDPYELRNLAHDPAYKPLLDDMLARLRELEHERLGPVEVPHYGGASLLEPLRPDPLGRPDAAEQAQRRLAGRGRPGRLRPGAVRRPAPRRPRLRRRRPREGAADRRLVT